MKTRTIIIAGVSVLALAGLGVATQTAAHSRAKPPTAGRKSTIGPAKGFASGETAGDGLPGVGAGRRGVGVGAPASRNQALPGGGKSGRSGRVGNTGSHDHVPRDAGSAMAGASAGTTLSRTNQHRAPDNNQISQTRFPPLSERLSKDYAPFFEKSSLSEAQRKSIVDAKVEEVTKMRELQLQGMSNEEVTETMSGYRRIRNEELRETLGDELYQSWSDYYHNIFNHRLVNDLTQRFEGTDLGITWEQREQLVSIFKNNRISYFSEIIREASDPIRNRTISTFTSAQDPVMQEAASILNQQQLEALRQYWSEIINLPR
jgi:hypothetical protein